MRVLTLKANLSMALREDLKVDLEKGKGYLFTEAFAREFVGVYGSLVESDIFLSNIIDSKELENKRWNGQDLNGKTFFAYRSSGIGDLLAMLLPIHYLKHKYPESKIIIGSSVSYESMLKNDKFIDEVVVMPYSLDLINDADFFMEFQGLLDIPRARELNFYDMFLEAFGLSYDELPEEFRLPKIFVNEGVDHEIETMINIVKSSHPDKPVCCIQLETSSVVRNYLPKYWKGLIDKINSIGIPTVLVGSREPCQAMINQYFLCDNRISYNFVEHCLTLNHFISVINHCDFIVAPDTSGLHIAGALGKPMLGIFNGVIPSKLRISHFKNAVGIETHPRCAPCFLHINRPCRYSLDDAGYSPCAYLADPARVFKTLGENILPLFGFAVLDKPAQEQPSRAVDEKRAVVTLAIGEQYLEQLEVARPSMLAYADKIGADFIAITEEKINGMFPNLEKFQIAEILDNYDRALYLDVDILVHPNCPDLFDMVPVDALGVVPDTPDAVWGNLNRYPDIMRIQNDLGDIGWRSGYFNSGVLVLSKIHKEMFLNPEDRTKTKTQFRDQTLLNYRFQKLLQSGKSKIFILNKAFNAMEITGFSSKTDPETKTKGMLMHFAFEHPKAEQMKYIAKKLGVYNE